MSKILKKSFFVALCFCLVQFAFSNGVAETSSSQKSVKWTLSYLKKSGDSLSSLSVDSLENLKKNETFRLSVKPTSDVFCCVVEELPNGSVSVVYSGTIAANQNHFLPGPDSSIWFKEKSSGIEKIHIVVSSESQDTLKTLVAAAQKSGATKTDINSLLEEISRLKKDNSKISMTPVKPASVGASSRSTTGTDFSSFNSSSSSSTNSSITNTEFSGNTTYAKTLRIKY